MIFAQAASSVSVWTQLGVGGIFVILVLRMVFDFLEKNRGGGGRTAIFDMIKDLHRWHAPDDHGEQTWKNTRMIKLMEDHAELLRDHHILLKQLLPILQKMASHQGVPP